MTDPRKAFVEVMRELARVNPDDSYCERKDIEEWVRAACEAFADMNCKAIGFP